MNLVSVNGRENDLSFVLRSFSSSQYFSSLSFLLSFSFLSSFPITLTRNESDISYQLIYIKNVWYFNIFDFFPFL